MNAVRSAIGEVRAGNAPSQDDPDEGRRNEIYRALFNGIGDTVLLVRDGRFLDVNDRALSMFRCTREQLIGKSPADISPPTQPDGLPSLDAALIKIATALTGERIVFEWRHKRFDGELFDAEVTLNKVEIPGETVFFGIVRDISDRKATEAKLSAAYKRFAWAFDTGPDAMVVTTLGSKAGEGFVLDVNRVAETIFGFPRDEILGKQVKDLGILGDLTALNAARDIVHEKGAIRGFRAQLRARDGQPLEAELSSSRFDLDGKTYSLIVIRDVSQQVEAEGKIRELGISLAKERDTLSAAFQANPDAVVIMTVEDDVDANAVVDCNEASERMFGYGRGEILGKTLAELEVTDLGAAAAMRDAYGKLAYFHNVPARMRRRDGSAFDADISSGGFVSEGQQRAIYVIRDVTLQREAQRRIGELTDSLKTERDKFASMFRTNPDAVFVFKVGAEPGTGAFQECNEAAERLLGRPRSAIIGRSIRDMGLITRPETLFAIRQELTEAGRVNGYRMELARGDGTRIEVELNAARFELHGEARYIFVVRDVTQRIESERRIVELNASLNSSLKKIRDITDNLPVFVSYHDMQRRFVFVNKTVQHWTMRNEAELLGRLPMDIIPSDLAATRAAVAARDPSKSERVEQTFRFPDGKVRTVDASFIPDFAPDGIQNGYYTLMADITEQRSIEEKLRQSQKMDAIGKLTGGIAHDFGNLLAVVQGSLELAVERLEGKDLEMMRLLKPALVAARRGGTLTRSLLAFARQQTLTPTVIDAAELARDTAELLSRTLPANIDLACAERAGAAKTEVDAGQLQNALLNLAVNARDAMPEGGRLTIETGFAHVDAAFNERHPDVAPGDYVTIAVSDTGAGMAPDVIARAFDPFFTTKGIGRGTGLGLSMVYGFAKQSHGHVTIYSEIGHGTTVRIYLPRYVGVGRAKAARDGGDAGAARHEQVLVVEDDEDVRFIAVRMLQSLGYVVVQTASAEAALDKIKDGETVDLLVTDLVLTDKMNGLQLAQAARAERPGLKVLCMSGYTEEAILRDRRLEPYMHFIQKPFGKSDLAAQVRAALDGDGG